MALLPILNKFNRGEVDPLAMARDDVAKVQSSVERIVNFLPMRLGPLVYRPGLMQLGTPLSSAVRMEPFVPTTSNPFQIVFCSDNNIRIMKRLGNTITAEGDWFVERETGTGTTIINETFDEDITGWTDADGAGSTSVWKTGGYMSLIGSGTTSAKRWQTVTAGTGSNAIRIIVEQAPIILNIGTSGVDSNDIFSGTLLPGDHSLLIDNVSDTDPYTITVANDKDYEALISKIEAEGSGIMTLPIDLNTADMDNLRVTQSADIMYCACSGHPQFRVERRGDNSWSVTKYRPTDGPFRSINSSDITMAAGALNGDTTLTASENYFSTEHVGALFKLVSLGQEVTSAVSAGDNGTNSIKVTGVAGARIFSIVITGTWVGTVTLQRSADDANWEDVTTYTTNQSRTYNDSLDNSELFYRLYVKSGDYTSGTIDLKLDYTGGSIEGVAKVTGYTSGTVVNVQVLQDFGSTDATRDWYEGEWSDYRGYPTAVALYEGRLWFAGTNKVWGSVSDAYSSFDRSIEGDSKSIFRTIGFGPVDFVNWLVGTNRLLMGIDSDEIAVRSSSFGEVLTDDNANLKSGSSQGAAPIAPVKIDDAIMFVQGSKRKVLNLQYAIDKDNHAADDLMTLNPNICDSNIKRLVVTRQPETRVFALLEDGTMRVYLYDPSEDVEGWSRIETAGSVVDIAVLPADGTDYSEDQLYAIVDFNGSRLMTRMGMISQSLDYHTDICRNAVNDTASGSLIGMTELANQVVEVWDQTNDTSLGTFTVTPAGSVGDDNIQQGLTYTVGVPHEAYLKTAKLSRYIADQVFGRQKRVVGVALMLADYISGTINYGDESTNVYPMPDIENGKVVAPGQRITDYDEIPLEFDGDEDTDPRIEIRSTAPCTLMALIYGIKNPENPYGNSE